MSEQSTEDSVQVGPAETKRRRYTVSKVKSCAECRRLKLRCDRSTPCENCVRRGTGSICPDGALKSAKGRTLILDSNQASYSIKGSLTELLDRIASLEAALSTLNEAHPLLGNAYHFNSDGEAPSLVEDVHDGDGSAESTVQGLTTSHAGNRLQSQRDSPSRRNHGSARKESTSGQSRQDGLEEDESHGHLQISGDGKTSRFFGDASSLFFVPQTPWSDIHRNLASDEPYTFRAGWLESFIFEHGSALRPEHALSALVAQLPSRKEAEGLVQMYFENVAWGTAILDRNVFDTDVFERFYGGKPPDAQRLAVLYFMLALGSLFDPSVPAGAENNPYTRDLFALGRACLSIDSSGSIIFVQAVHLMVTWLNNGGRAVSSNQTNWSLLGLAMRVVQALGLHRNGRHYALPSAEVEERERVFWEVNVLVWWERLSADKLGKIYAYDVQYATTSGRPRSMTSATYDVPFPKTKDGGDFYHEYRYRLSGDVFCKINDQQSAIAPAPYEKVLELDRELRRFQQQLPDQLTVEETPMPNTLPYSQTRNIQRRSLQFQTTTGFLFLHRGWFARALLEGPEEPLCCKYSPSYVGCLEACKLIIGVVRQLWDEARLVCQRRWFFLFHSFTACACLAAAVIRAPQSMLAQSSLLALEQGLKLFEETGKQEELAMLLPLRDTARRSFAHSGRISLPNTDADLALLGRGHKKVSRHDSPGDSHTPASSAPSQASSLPRLNMQNLLSTQSNSGHSTSSHLVDGSAFEQTSLPDSASVRQPEHRQSEQPVVDGNDPYHLPSPSYDVRPVDNYKWYNGGESVSDFDFGIFLASVGITDDLNDWPPEIGGPGTGMGTTGNLYG